VNILEGSEGNGCRKCACSSESRDDKDIWSTIGVSESVIEASWLALVDSIQYKAEQGQVESQREGK